MNTISFLKNEILTVKKQTDSLLNSIPKELWNTTPKNIESNINWQLGHILLANYLHGIASISGPNEKVRAYINVKEYIKFYGVNSIPEKFQDTKPTNNELIRSYEAIYTLIFKELASVSEKDLDTNVAFNNPAANTKKEALTWLFKHQSWHNGQIAMLKRILNQ